MTDSHRGMEGSDYRYHKLIRTVVPTALLAGVLAVAGCGGGGSSTSSSKPPAPVTQSSSGNGGVVAVQGTAGLVGSAGRATSKSLQFDDKTGKIPANANHKPKPKHPGRGVGATEACQGTDITPSD